MEISVESGIHSASIEYAIDLQIAIDKDSQSLIKALATVGIGSKKPNARISDCVICSTSTLKESELCSAGIPAYGASGISGYTADALCESDSILITKDGSGVGAKRYVRGPHSFVGTLCSLTHRDGIYLPYIYYAMMNMNFDAYKTGQAIPHIYFKDYGKERLFCPTYSEQVKLAKGLEALDKKVVYEQRLLSKFHSVKRHFLTQLFI